MYLVFERLKKMKKKDVSLFLCFCSRSLCQGWRGRWGARRCPQPAAMKTHMQHFRIVFAFPWQKQKLLLYFLAYNAHPHFQAMNVGKEVNVLCEKIWYITYIPDSIQGWLVWDIPWPCLLWTADCTRVRACTCVLTPILFPKKKKKYLWYYFYLFVTDAVIFHFCGATCRRLVKCEAFKT